MSTPFYNTTMKTFLFFFFASFILLAANISAQSIDKIINPGEVDRIERILSSDSMQGRRTFTPSIDMAADFIASEFKKNGLQYFPGLNDYRQSFSMVRAKLISAEGNF